MTKRKTRRVGVALVAHGSRRPGGLKDLRRYARTLRTAGGFDRVLCAFLEINSPTLPQALDRLAAMGMGTVVASSFFLLAGRHTRKDLPRMVREARRRHPGTRFRLADPLGFDRRLAGVLLDRIRKAR